MTDIAERPRTKAARKPGNALQVVKEQVVDRVSDRIAKFIHSGQLHLPPSYSPQNAMHAAWLILQETKDKDLRPVLEVCSQASIANALFRMVVRGLDPAKKQGYFIAYGKQLSFQESYFGNMMLAQRDAGVLDVLPMVVYAGDKFDLAIERGRYVVEYHKPRLDADASTPITHAYCIVEFADGRAPRTEVMRWDQIQTSWRKSKTYKVDGKSGPHHEQPDQMAIRTVINRALKPLINSSTAPHLAEVLAEIERSDTIAAAEEEIELEAREYANREPLTLDAGPVEEQADEPDGESADAEVDEVDAADPGF